MNTIAETASAAAHGGLAESRVDDGATFPEFGRVSARHTPEVSAVSLRISVAMTTHQGAKHVQDQLDSIVAQSRQPDEMSWIAASRCPAWTFRICGDSLAWKGM